ncbi:MAG: alpha/beta hydrolase [Acidimicrobiia bacterium]|nr:alpha/beta hydrolase [Acidimicrobiia bacterium]
MTVQSTTQTIQVGDHTRLRRRWEAAEPWATVLIVHGLGEHSGRYERTGGLFADAGLTTSSFDLLGHGDSAGARCHVDTFSDYLDEVETELQLSSQGDLPVVLLGLSLGGLITLDYLSSGRLPPDCAIVSGPALGGGKAWQRMLAPLLGRLFPKLSIPTAFTAEQLSRDPAVGEAYFADPLVSRTASTRLGAELFAAGDRVRANLDKLTVPMLVIHGGADELVPPAVSAVLHDLPGVERRLYPKLRHEVLNEPEGPEVVADMVEWLRAAVDV